MDNKKKKKLLLASAALLCLAAYPYKKHYHPQFEILNEENGPFAKYSNGYVYIGSEYYLSNLNNISENDVLICDERYKRDPNMSVYQSYNIDDADIRNEILEIMCVYETMYPSDWDRTIESMRLEWLYHNVSYFFKYKTTHSADTDFNNADESIYDNEVLSRVFRL